MWKDKILAMLKTKYKHLGLSAKILELKAAQLAKTVEKEEDIETAVDGVEDDLQILQSVLDTVRTENANSKKPAKPEKKGADDEKPPVEPDPQKTETKTENPELKAINEALSKITGIVMDMKAEKTTTSRRSVLESKLNELKGLPESDKKLRLQLMEALKHESDEDFNIWMESQVSEAGEIAKTAPSSEFEGMPNPISGTGGTGKAESQKFLDNVVNGMNF